MKKIPMRKCIITSEKYPKKDLLRVVRDPSGNVFVDITGKANGHGAYVVKNKEVIMQAKKKKALNHHLEVNVPDEVYDEMIKYCEK